EELACPTHVRLRDGFVAESEEQGFEGFFHEVWSLAWVRRFDAASGPPFDPIRGVLGSPLVGEQLLELLSRVVQTRHRGALRNLHDVRDLLVGEALQLAKEDRLPLVFREGL